MRLTNSVANAGNRSYPTSRPAVLDRCVLPTDIAGLFQPLVKSGNLILERAWRPKMEEADYWSRGLLRVYSERPCRPVPAIALMKSRRRTTTQGAALDRLWLATSRLQQGFATGEMGFIGQCARQQS